MLSFYFSINHTRMESSKTSKLQTKFPLSPRKFWKKLSEELWLIIFFLWSLIFNIYYFSDGVIAWDDIFWMISLWFLGIMTIRLLFKIWYIKKYISNYYYEGEDQYLTIRKGVFTSTEIHVPYGKIQDVYVDQDMVDRFIFGLYDVHISSATAWSAMEAHIDGVDKACAEWLKEYILSKMQWWENKKEVVKTVESHQNDTISISQSTILWNKNISNITYPLSTTRSIVNTVNTFITSIVAIWGAWLYWYFNLSEDDGTISFRWSMIEKTWLSLTVTVILVIIIALIGSISYTRLFKKNYTFEFLKDYIQQKTGILSRSESNVPYGRIQDITIQQSFLERVVWIYKVHVANASQWNNTNNGAPTSDISFVWLSKKDAEEISDLLRKHVFWTDKKDETV